MVVHNIGSLYRNYERHISSVALILGFIFDILTLRRADALWENFWIMLHLLIVATSILLLNRKGGQSRASESGLDFWLVNFLQFSLGGLLSAFLILYFRSATLAVSWPFLLILLVALIANERLRKNYERLTYQVSFLFLALFLFSIFLVPVVIGVIGPLIFILSGVVSLILIRLFLALLERVNEERFITSIQSIRVSLIGIFVFINLLYFTSIIPPIPLSLRDGGVYHSVERGTAGDYIVRREPKSWIDYFKATEEVNLLPGKSLYAYTAIFSPAKFNVSIIVHDWQFLDETKGGWVSVSRISLPIAGGRDRGYRTYSISGVVPGKWRIKVLTERGQALGQIVFRVKEAQIAPELVSETR